MMIHDSYTAPLLGAHDLHLLVPAVAHIPTPTPHARSTYSVQACPKSRDPLPQLARTHRSCGVLRVCMSAWALLSTAKTRALLNSRSRHTYSTRRRQADVLSEQGQISTCKALHSTFKSQASSMPGLTSLCSRCSSSSGDPPWPPGTCGCHAARWGTGTPALAWSFY